MILRFALIALLVSSAGARADQGDAPRAPRAPRAPASPALSAWRSPPAPARGVVEYDERESTDTTLSVPARARLELENFGGEITVSAWDRSALRVQARHRRGTSVGCEVGPVAVVLRSITRLRIPDFAGRRHVRVEEIQIPAQVDYRLTVPRWMSLRLSGVNTGISVEGVDGDVSAEVVSGPVVVRGGRGAIRASAITGSVEVVGARGSVEASSVNEGVTLRDVAGRVRAESVNGDVELLGIASDGVEASTVSGNLRFEGAMRAGGAYRFESHSGDVTVVLPERPDVAVSVGTYSGEFASSFPVQVRGLKRGKQFEFTLGDGRAELSLESFSGLIRLVRAGETSGRARVIAIPRDR